MKKVTAVIIVCLMLPTMALDLLSLQIVPKVEEVEPAGYDNIDLLAKCVEAEAGNQGLYGKQLVVDVILNRVDSDSFPNTVEEVIKQDGQFETWSLGMVNSADPTEETYSAIDLELIKRTDTQILYFTAGYYNPSCIPAYSYEDHYFGY